MAPVHLLTAAVTSPTVTEVKDDHTAAARTHEHTHEHTFDI